MEVIKRDGRREIVQFDKITARIKNLCSNEDLKRRYIEPILIAQKTIASIYSGITTEEIDKISAIICDSMILTHYKYSQLGAKICISNLHKKTSNSFYETTKKIYEHKDFNGLHVPLVSEKYYKVVNEHKDIFDKIIDYERDYMFDYFGFKTLERSYLIKINGKIIERPQHLIMRVAVGIHFDDIDNIVKTYDYMSKGLFTHATPTLFNAGSNRSQLSSCFLLGTEDSLTGIAKTMTSCMEISKWAGGIGIHVSNIRAKGSIIRGTNGRSNGIIPMIKVYNEIARYIDQGGGKRNGSIAVYLEPWHADVFEFLELKKNTGAETERARDIFLALWVPDLFMKRLETNELWSLMCPDECPGLNECYGDEFERLYTEYEQLKKYKKQVRVMDLWNAILESQMESGVPYVAYKDHVNRKNNQQNIGIIKSSNLCVEINEVSDANEYAVCNLASIAVNRFIKPDGTYDFDKLCEVSKQCIINLNKIIDINYYSTPETKISNMRHRPVGLGVQGLADAYMAMKYPYESAEAFELNKQIFETIYYGALSASCELAKIDGHYETFKGSPFSKGIFQFDMWGVKPSNRWNWDKLRNDVIKYGTRNSLLTSLMPTASTSQILGNTESFEALTSNIYTRRTLAGTFTIVNKFLVDDLVKLDLWNDKMKEKIVYYNGSIQSIPEIPDELKSIYKTVWEIKQKAAIDQSADRGAFIDQSQSMNLYLYEPDSLKLTSALYHGWKRGLKTGSYYIRSKPSADAIKFTVNTDTIKELDAITKKNEIKQLEKEKEEIKICPLIIGRKMTPEELKECLMCGS